MDTYKIELHQRGWFKVTITAPNGESRVRHGFVSELAAQKWVDKCQKTGITTRNLLAPAKGRG